MNAQKQTYNTNVQVSRRNTSVGVWHEQLGEDELLNSEDDAVFAAQANGCSAVFHRLASVFYLKTRKIQQMKWSATGTAGCCPALIEAHLEQSAL